MPCCALPWCCHAPHAASGARAHELMLVMDLDSMPHAAERQQRGLAHPIPANLAPVPLLPLTRLAMQHTTPQQLKVAAGLQRGPFARNWSKSPGSRAANQNWQCARA